MITRLIANGHSHAAIMDYTLPQFEAYCLLVDELTNKQLAHWSVANQISTHGDQKTIQSYLDNLNKHHG